MQVVESERAKGLNKGRVSQLPLCCAYRRVQVEFVMMSTYQADGLSCSLTMFWAIRRALPERHAQPKLQHACTR